MSTATSLRAKLLADAAVAALIGTRMYPVKGKQDYTYPYLVYKRERGRRDYSLQGVSEVAMAVYRIYSCSDDYAEAWSVIDAVKTDIDRFKGSSGGVTYLDIRWLDDWDEYDDKLEMYKAVARLDVWYVE